MFQYARMSHQYTAMRFWLLKAKRTTKKVVSLIFVQKLDFDLLTGSIRDILILSI